MPTIEANGIHQYYEISGEGPPVLLLHGLGSSTRDWEFQAAALEGAYRVIAVDLRGHGQSEKPPGPYSVPLFAEDVYRFVRALDLVPLHLVGYSLGGLVAFQFALSYPETLLTLTILNSAPALNRDQEAARAEADRRIGVVHDKGMRGMGEALANGMFPNPAHADLREEFADRWGDNDVDAYIAATCSVLGWSVWDRVGEIQTPTLVISADNDLWPLSEKEEYIALLPDAQYVVIEDAHHMAPREKPDAVNAALLDFLAAHR